MICMCGVFRWFNKDGGSESEMECFYCWESVVVMWIVFDVIVNFVGIIFWIFGSFFVIFKFIENNVL